MRFDVQTVELVTDALWKTGGNILEVSQLFGVTRSATEMFIRNHPELKDVLRASREIILDQAESGLGKAVRKGQSWAIRFVLETKGKKRGYTRQPVVSMGFGTNPQPQVVEGALPIVILLPDNGRSARPVRDITDTNHATDPQGQEGTPPETPAPAIADSADPGQANGNP